jgi:tetratricopeptide (TPR) repeat protein
MAIFYQHEGAKEKLAELLALLRKTYPFHQDHVFKQATTMGILGEHETAYRLFKRLLKSGEAGMDPCLYHYTAVAAYNIGRYAEAERLWLQTEKLDPQSDIPRFYLSQLKLGVALKTRPTDEHASISYHYHLPFEEQFRMLERSSEGIPDYMRRDPLVRSSFFWALRHGDMETKLQVIQAFGIIADTEVEDALRDFILEPNEDDYLKKVAFFVLRSMGADAPLQAVLEGESTLVHSTPYSPNLPVWEPEWQEVLELSLRQMHKRYDMIQQHDLETLWVEYLTRIYPDVPKIGKIAGWAAALEYLTAKMHRRAISYGEVAERYAISVATVSKNVKIIDQTCKLKEKMDAIFPKFANIVRQGNDT